MDTNSASNVDYAFMNKVKTSEQGRLRQRKQMNATDFNKDLNTDEEDGCDIPIDLG